jgi:hypothetical protein
VDELLKVSIVKAGELLNSEPVRRESWWRGKEVEKLSMSLLFLSTSFLFVQAHC